MRVVRSGDQSREGRAISPRVAEERRSKDVLHAANVRARRAGARRGRRAGKGVTSREPKAHTRDITTRRLAATQEPPRSPDTTTEPPRPPDKPPGKPPDTSTATATATASP